MSDDKKFYVLLTDDDDGTMLVACEDREQAEATAVAGVFSDGGVSAWLIPATALTQPEAVQNILRDGGNCHDLFEAVDNSRLREARITITQENAR